MPTTAASPGSFDVVILGGGPAGCAAAIEAARGGLSAAVVDRRPPGPPGEAGDGAGRAAARDAAARPADMLSPDAVPWLDRLGLWDVFDAVPRVEAPGIVSLWDGPDGEAPGETDFVRHPYGHGWHVDRPAFDAALAGAARRAGATTLPGSAARAVRRGAEGWEIDLAAAPGGPEAGRGPTSCPTLRGRWLIDATGRARLVGRQAAGGPDDEAGTPIRDRLVALVATVAAAALPDRRLYVEATAGGWWYAAPAPGPPPGGRVLVAFLTDADLLPRGRPQRSGFLARQLESTRLLSSLGLPSPDGPPRLVAAHTRWTGRVSGPRWLAAGDAALACDPLAGRGVCQALASGSRAGRAVVAACRGGPAAAAAAVDDYRAWWASEFRAYRAERDRLYSSVRRWPDEPFWRRRAAAELTTGGR